MPVVGGGWRWYWTNTPWGFTRIFVSWCACTIYFIFFLFGSATVYFIEFIIHYTTLSLNDKNVEEEWECDIILSWFWRLERTTTIEMWCHNFRILTFGRDKNMTVIPTDISNQKSHYQIEWESYPSLTAWKSLDSWLNQYKRKCWLR